MEFYALLKTPKPIIDRLSYDTMNKSTPADDLQLLPREPRDDKRVRRARNSQAVDLCKRYLSLTQIPGVTAKPGFRVDTVEIDGKPVSVFLPADGTKFAAQKRDLDDGTTVWFVWEDGKEAPPEAAAAPPTPEAVPAKPDAPPAKPDAKAPDAGTKEKQP